MTNSIGLKIIRPSHSPDRVDQATKLDNSAVHHDMDPTLPADAPGNVIRKRQQLKARAVAGRHIDKALSTMPASDEAKASRKAKLIDPPAGIPSKPRPA